MLSVVVPVHNEAENIVELHRRVALALRDEGLGFELLFVDDGSNDATPALIEELAERDPRVRRVSLSRNFGHQAAVSAGLDFAEGDAVVVMDGDLQDPPELIPRLLAEWREGAEVVYAVRASRDEPRLKRLAYSVFYRLLRVVSDLEMPLDSGDFSLMDRKVVDVLTHLPERLRFIRGLRTFVGFRQVGVSYDRPSRHAGRSKYGLRALFRLAVDGLVGFSGYPLRVVAYAGLLVAFAALGLMGWALWDAIGPRTAPRGWASTLVVVLVLGAFQMLSLGIMGEYVRQIFLEVKQRPTYIVSQATFGTGRAGRRLSHLPARRRIRPLDVRRASERRRTA